MRSRVAFFPECQKWRRRFLPSAEHDLKLFNFGLVTVWWSPNDSKWWFIFNEYVAFIRFLFAGCSPFGRASYSSLISGSLNRSSWPIFRTFLIKRWKKCTSFSQFESLENFWVKAGSLSNDNPLCGKKCKLVLKLVQVQPYSCKIISLKF